MTAWQLSSKAGVMISIVIFFCCRIHNPEIEFARLLFALRNSIYMKGADETVTVIYICRTNFNMRAMFSINNHGQILPLTGIYLQNLYSPFQFNQVHQGI